MQNKRLNLIISQVIILLFLSRSVFAISKIERMLKDNPVKFSFIIFGVCGVFVGVLLLLSYYKVIFSAIRRLVYPSFSFFKDKKEFERHIIPAGEFGDISLQNARLIVKEAEGKVKEFLITSKKEFWIGRDEDNQLILDGATVSRKHAKIRPQIDGYAVYDLRSKSGTFVNGRLIQSHILKTGDGIGIAHININITFKKQGEEIVKIEPEKKKKEKYLGPERRKYPRLDMKATVNYLAYSSTGISKDAQTYTMNISGNGLCIITAGCITRNTIIELEIEIPDYSSSINALARVMYSRKRKMDSNFDTGIRFTDISDEERKYIVDYTNSKIAR